MDRILENGVEAYADEILVKLFAPASFVRHRPEVEAVREMIVNTSTESLCNTLFALAARKETRGKLMEIGIPTLILVGKEDQITPLEASQLMHRQNPWFGFGRCGPCGSCPNMENPVVFNKHLVHFVRAVYRRARSHREMGLRHRNTELLVNLTLVEAEKGAQSVQGNP